jgi:hypothetical protein
MESVVWIFLFIAVYYWGGSDSLSLPDTVNLDLQHSSFLLFITSTFSKIFSKIKKIFNNLIGFLLKYKTHISMISVILTIILLILKLYRLYDSGLFLIIINYILSLNISCEEVFILIIFGFNSLLYIFDYILNSNLFITGFEKKLNIPSYHDTPSDSKKSWNVNNMASNSNNNRMSFLEQTFMMQDRLMNCRASAVPSNFLGLRVVLNLYMNPYQEATYINALMDEMLVLDRARYDILMGSNRTSSIINQARNFNNNPNNP